MAEELVFGRMIRINARNGTSEIRLCRFVPEAGLFLFPDVQIH